MLHPSLKRQLGTLALDPSAAPTDDEWRRFLERVSRCLEEAEHRTAPLAEAIIRSLGCGLCVLDAAGRIQSVNPEGERVLGRTQPELFGRELSEVFAPAPGVEPEPWRRATRRRIEAGRAFRDDASLATYYGRTLTLSLAVNPILRNGEVIGAVVAFTDGIERRPEAPR